MLKREWSSTPTGPLVSPWLISARDSRVITLFGSIVSSIDVPLVATESIPFVAEDVFASLLQLAGEDSAQPVRLVINNSGGSVPAGLTIIQGIEHLQAKGIDVEVVVLGSAMSMASVILAAGTVGKRFSLERSRIHLHSGQIGLPQDRPDDVNRIMDFINGVREELYVILARRTKLAEYYLKCNDLPLDKKTLADEGKRIKFIKNLLEKETFLTPREAVTAGIVDEILSPGYPRIDALFRPGKRGHK